MKQIPSSGADSRLDRYQEILTIYGTQRYNAVFVRALQ
jgi:hypothetical protein